MYIICLLRNCVHFLKLQATSLKYTPTKSLQLCKSHRWLCSAPSFCCFMLTIPSSPIAMESHSAHQLPTCVWACLLGGGGWSILSWEWDTNSAAGTGNGICPSPATMPSSGRAKQWIDGEQHGRAGCYLTFLNLPHIQTYMAPFTPINMWSVSRFAFWIGTNPITLSEVITRICMISCFLYGVCHLIYVIFVPTTVCTGKYVGR